jgi:signal transduction histidine kinase
LDLSRIESGAFRLSKSRVDVRELIASFIEVERYRAESLGLVLSAVVPAQLPPVQGDFEALRRVVQGLIDNAIKYTPEGGRIIVSVKMIDERLALKVEDNGQGISEADQPFIFDKFYRARSESTEAEANEFASGTAASGVGLGLYLAKHVVNQLGGEIIVASGPGRGTIFTVLLPTWTAGNAEADDKEETNVEAIAGS